MKLLIVAQSPGTERVPPPGRALEGSSSLRNLARYANLDDPEDVYRRASVTNLIPWFVPDGAWPTRLAYRKAHDLLVDSGEFTHVITLGARARHAFRHWMAGTPTDWFTWHDYHGLGVAFSPHPSGLSREWNEAVNRLRGRRFWSTTLAGVTPACARIEQE